MRKLFLVIIILVFSLLSCDNPFVENENSIEKQIQPKTKPEPLPGYGYFAISPNNVNARDIIPQAPVLDDVEYFILVFTGTSLLPPVTVTFEKDELYTYVELLEDTYELVATAYLETDKPALRAYLDGIVITEGDSVDEVVDFLPITYGTGTGKFIWDITLTGDFDTADMTVKNISTSASNNYNLLGTVSPNSPAGSLVLNAGYYLVTIVLEKTGYQPIYHIMSLHIYENMESEFEETLTDADFNLLKYPVNFYYYDDVTIDEQTDGLYGQIITPPFLNDPEKTDYIFAGWYTDYGTFLNEWNLATDLVTGEVNLYANWELDD